MKAMSPDIFDRWTRGAWLVAMVALAWTVFVPGDVLWSFVLAAGLIGAALALLGTEAVIRELPSQESGAPGGGVARREHS